MIRLKTTDGFEPKYQSEHSAACDLKSTIYTILEPGQRKCIPTGVWIDEVLWDKVPKNCVPELQVRARSGLSIKFGITLCNGIGTIDADYPNEIGVLLWNSGSETFTINKGDRIAQMTLNLCHRIENVLIKSENRTGGFGSTGV